MPIQFECELVGIRNKSYTKDGLEKHWNTYFFQIEDEVGNLDVVNISTSQNLNNKRHQTGTLKMKTGENKEGETYIKFISFE